MHKIYLDPTYLYLEGETVHYLSGYPIFLLFLQSKSFALKKQSTKFMIMKIMESLAIILFIFLALLQISCSIRTFSKHISLHNSNVPNPRGFTFPLFPKNHPKIRRHFKSLSPLAVSPLVSSDEDRLYYVEFEMGTPSAEKVAVFDTGSDLTWFKRSQFQPGDSITYLRLRCNYSICGNVSHMCLENSWCSYERRYADGTSSTGEVGADIFSFFEPDEVFGHDPNSAVNFEMLFGIENKGNHKHEGVMGVCNTEVGLLTLLSVDRFSTSFPMSRDEMTYVRFGEDAHLLGEAIPLVEYKGIEWQLHFNVKSIRVGGVELKNLSASTSIQTRLNGHPFCFDTGAGFTHLSPVAMDGFLALVKKSVDDVPHKLFGYELCYDAYKLNAKESLSKLTFEFEFVGGGSPIHLDFANVWIGKEGHYCLAFHRFMNGDRNVYGNRQMMGYNFGFDLSRRKLYYQKLV